MGLAPVVGLGLRLDLLLPLDLDRDPSEADYRRVFHVTGLVKGERIEDAFGPEVTLGKDKHFFSTGMSYSDERQLEALIEVVDPPMTPTQVKELVARQRPG